MVLVLGLEVFFCGLIISCLQSSHLIKIFLGLEFMTLGLCILVVLSFPKNGLIVLLSFLCVAVSEAAVMLSFIVQVTRVFGDDRVNSKMMVNS
uniref:NADH-ubiquinone oxidoreductase chain 4L n=1 Tax=Modiolus philippinarum TaxID=310899 RepID=A0A1Z2WWV5_9BIVA|nr:NADH dehydrogenase subunit 4L [Modiolus philippinarum]ASB29977.1 NADH dehydrogenase subunit 4L [Modiolus philippinarum]